MKSDKLNNMKTILVFLLVTSMLPCFGQRDYGNVVKWAPPSLYFNSALFQWEQYIGRNSVVLDIGIPINRSISGRANVGSDDFTSTKFGIETVRVGYRFYVQKRDHTGLYLEPYVGEQTARAKVVCIDNVGTVEGYMCANNFGCQIGKQWVIGKHWVIDFYPFAIAMGRANGRVHSWSPTEDGAITIQNYMNNNFRSNFPTWAQDGYNVYRAGKITETEINSFVYPWFRGGIMIGFKF